MRIISFQGAPGYSVAMRNLLVILLLLIPLGSSWADDRSQIVQMISGSGTINNLNIDGAWAMYCWSDRDAGGMGLLHKVDGRWVRAAGGGGVMGPDRLFVMGVPQRSLAKLLDRGPGGYRYPEVEIRQAANQGPAWIDRVRQVDLETSDLSFRTDWELTLMRNEIFAVHGRSFQDAELRNYFQTRKWYRPNPAYREASLSQRERRNARFIAEYQASHRQ